MNGCAIDIEVQSHAVIYEKAVGSDTVSKDVTVRMGLDRYVYLDVGIGIQLIASTVEIELAFTFKEDGQTVRIVLARKEGIEINTGTVVVRIVEIVVDGILTIEYEVIFQLIIITVFKEYSQ